MPGEPWSNRARRAGHLARRAPGGASARPEPGADAGPAAPQAPPCFHDLSHTGNQLAAATGATLRVLMDRMGHLNARAALIYLHGSDQRQREIAQALSDLAKAEIRRRAKRPKNLPTRRVPGT